MRRVSKRDIAEQAPLAVTLYDHDGHVVLAAGEVPARHPRWPALLGTGLYCHPEPVWQRPPQSSLQTVLHTIAGLSMLRQHLPALTDVEGAALALARTIEVAWQRHPDVPMVAVMLLRDGPLPDRHAVHTACVLKRVLRCLSEDEGTDARLMAIALTLHLPDSMVTGHASHATQREADAVVALRRLGMIEQAWLTTIQQARALIANAHLPPTMRPESGKPPEAAQLLALADLFCTRVEDETLRLPDGSRSVLRDILIEHGAHFDVRLGSLFIRALGVYPVGTVVVMSSGEIGVVCDLSDQVDAPWVCSLVGPLGAPLAAPTLRDTRDPRYAICESLGPTELLDALDLRAIWGDEAADYPLSTAAAVHDGGQCV